MKIIILGAGMIGVNTAYFLQKSGHQVTIIDRQKEAGLECSFSNGAQLSYCKAEPLASFSAVKNALKWMWRDDAPLLFRFPRDIATAKWMFEFLKNCPKSKAKENTKKILDLGLYSKKVLHENMTDFDFDFHHLRDGKYFIFRNEKDFNSYLNQARLQEQFGSRYEVIEPQDILKTEPALEKVFTEGKIYKVIKNPMDESADGLIFTQKLAEKFQKLGGEIKYSTTVKSLNFDKSQKKIKSVTIIDDSTGEAQEITADEYVLSLGAYSSTLLKSAKINLPIYPLKGYSLTVDIEETDKAPYNSLTDYSQRIVYSRIGGKMRVAGTAEFAGFNHDITQKRVDMLIEDTKEIFPKSGDIDSCDKWSCLRPATPDSVPVFGRSHKCDNLVFNTGHGFLGWTQCLASAKITQDVIEGKQTEIDISGYLIDRFN